MELRAQARWVAGCFDVDAAAAAPGASAGIKLSVLPENQLVASKCQYVHRDASGVTSVASIKCFATPEIMDLQTEAMRAFLERHPHATLSKVEAVDEAVEKAIAEYTLRGKPMDKAVRSASVEDTHLWAYSTVDTAPEEARAQPAAAATGGGNTSGGGAAKKQRTPEEQAQSDKRRVEQLERENRNLREGKKVNRGGGGGGGGKGGGGKGGGWNGPPAGMMWTAPQYPQWTPPQWGGPPAPAAGKGGGPPGFPGPVCPPDVCKDFNFKGGGCTRGTACTYKHVCCVCQAQHPFKGNH